MININALRQLKAFARQDGALLALLWALSFAFNVMNPSSSLGSILTILTPFFVGWRLLSFRNYALDGYISYRRALAYCMYTFFYGALLFGVLQFMYFKFLDGGRFMSMVSTVMLSMTKAYKEQGLDAGNLKDAVTMLGELKPLELAFILMMYNLFIGWISSVMIAVFGIMNRKRPNKDANNIFGRNN